MRVDIGAALRKEFAAKLLDACASGRQPKSSLNSIHAQSDVGFADRADFQVRFIDRLQKVRKAWRFLDGPQAAERGPQKFQVSPREQPDGDDAVFQDGTPKPRVEQTRVNRDIGGGSLSSNCTSEKSDIGC